MENENESWEQPSTQDDVQVADVKENEGTISSANEGSQLGKFKDAESLYEAYNNLQAEFTRKCQKLSELEKQKQQEEIVEQPKTPVFAQTDWTNKVSDFLQKNKQAKAYAKEISSIIMSNPELMNKDDALSLAWAKVVEQKFVSPEKIVNDEEYIDKYIMSNDKIKSKILNEYIKELQKNSPPPIISVKNGGNISFPKQKQPTSLLEAKSLVEELFNTKGD
ncbi:MAG: hypothetical protein IJA69_04155 [Clostridia bacterium]|nr:hypothetical protein [Clostridia bacterium]